MLGLVHSPGGTSVACGLLLLRAGPLLLHDRGSGGTVRRVSYAIHLCSALRWAFHFAAVGYLVPANVLAWSAPEGIAPWTARAQTSDRPSPSPRGAGPLHEVFPDLPGCPSSAPPLPFPPAAPDLGATSTPQTSVAWVALSEMSDWRSLPTRAPPVPGTPLGGEGASQRRRDRSLSPEAIAVDGVGAACRLYCPVPGCPSSDDAVHRGWTSKQTLISHVDSHLAGTLQGQIPPQ